MYYLLILCILFVIGYYSYKYLFFVLIGMILSFKNDVKFPCLSLIIVIVIVIKKK